MSNIKPKILTHAQALELKWFCQNVNGVRQDFYRLNMKVSDFDARVARLEKSCALIEKYLGEPIGEFASPWAPSEIHEVNGEVKNE